MNMEIIGVPSNWGTELKQKHITVLERNHRLVVLFPGRNYPCEMPALYYAGNTAIQYQYDLLILEYGYQAARSHLDLQDLPRVIDECSESIQRIVDRYDEVVFISKSLGTVVAGEVHCKLQRPIRHLFLTPLIETIPFINRSCGIVIYGSNDPFFKPEDAGRIDLSGDIRRIEIPNADHAFETGDVQENIAILQRLAKTYGEFLSWN
ncbi:alpha/beta hydrolase [Cohnella terricola]|uniref:Alpha/beta hydrolase n=1 Tax=Cohnella terricola TaxID=1289167 RepID=A0A559J8Z5_9BACL|nr:alpha/beta hydrolase [Cohnella terricola]TVX96327.1 alpha/beta hydrolase [Cohnella terricola]